MAPTGDTPSARTNRPESLPLSPNRSVTVCTSPPVAIDPFRDAARETLDTDSR